jgi:hypothetical protein
MTSSAMIEPDRRAILKRRAEVRIARLGRIVEALNRRRTTVQREASVGAAAAVVSIVLVLSLVSLRAIYGRRARNRTFAHRLAQWIDPDA